MSSRGAQDSLFMALFSGLAWCQAHRSLSTSSYEKRTPVPGFRRDHLSTPQWLSAFSPPFRPQAAHLSGCCPTSPQNSPTPGGNTSERWCFLSEGSKKRPRRTLLYTSLKNKRGLQMAPCFLFEDLFLASPRRRSRYTHEKTGHPCNTCGPYPVSKP